MEITLKTIEGDKTVKALVVERGLALHVSTSKMHGKHWTVTHIHSGTALWQNIPKRSTALKFIHKLTAGFDWNEDMVKIQGNPIAYGLFRSTKAELI